MYVSPVSIVIPNYNGEQILKRSLVDVLAAADKYAQACEIIVVDDASRDNSCRLLEDNFPQIQLIQNQVNKGFADSVNRGVASASHPIIILLNSDVFPDSEFIAPLTAWFGHPDTFAVSPLILNGSGKPSRVSWNLSTLVRGEIRQSNWDFAEIEQRARKKMPMKSLFASGGSVALRKEMFDRLGGFLPIYKPFYYEDRDLCTRAWQRGWKTYFEPQSRVVHDHQSTIGRFFPAKQIRVVKRRNRLFYLWLHLSRRKLLLSHIPWILVRLLLRLLRLDFVYMQALFRAVFSLNRIIAMRAAIHQGPVGRPLEDIIREIWQWR
jgi:GT2 family glycosyltransferase